MNDHVEILLQPLDTGRVAELAAHMAAAVGALWQAGRLRALVDTPEGLAVVQIYESTLASMRTQVADRLAAGQKEFRGRISLPAEHARPVMSFVRTLLGQVSDPVLMELVGGEPFSKEDVEFIESVFAYIDRRIAEHA